MEDEHAARGPGQHPAVAGYRSINQAADGTLHATYSFFAPAASVTPDAERRLPRKSIKHANFNEAWIMER